MATGGSALILVFVIALGTVCSGQQEELERSILQKFIQQSKVNNGGLGVSDWAAAEEDTASSTNYCQLAGVFCDSASGIVKIDLQGRGLSSPLPTIICKLPNLTELILFNNSYKETFPEGLFTNCSKKLSLLDLSFNYFGGALPDAGWHNLSGLTHLDVSHNLFTGQFPASIGNELLGLQVLITWSNGFTGVVPPELGNLTDLINLTISWNKYSPSGRLPRELSKLKKLTWFTCAACNLAGAFPTWLSELDSIHYLDLSYNLLSGNLPEDAFSWPDIRQLELYYNSFTGLIPSTISQLTTLTDLDLSCNFLEGPIPAGLGMLTNLALLNLWNNSLSGTIPWELGNLTSLRIFQLYNNSLTGTIPETLGRGGELFIFDVSGNSLQGPVPPYLCDGKNLTKLIFFNNNISGSIPEDYGNCTTLIRVRIRQNQLFGPVPEGLWGLPNMTILELSENNLTGSISPNIGSATKVTQLKIGGNGFSGSLPESIGDLSQLETLDMAGNEFSGAIPDTLGKCQSLEVLSMEYNFLTGAIPDVIGDLQKLNSIDLSHNQLTGTIPVSLGKLNSALNLLSLSHNRLTGHIPSSLSNLQFSLGAFDVSFNDLSGNLPFQLGGAFTEASFEGNAHLCLSQNCERRMGPGRGAWIAGSLLVVLAALALLVCFCCKRKTLYRRMRQENSLRAERWTLMAFEKIDFDEYHILACLDEDNVIGQGSSGKVYHGHLENGQSLAVKKLWVHASRSGSHSDHRSHLHDYGFKAEIGTVGNVRHRNIVNLICCCTNERGESLLVYEYMPNGSVGDLLYGKYGKKAQVLDWSMRFRIALGAAKGLAYLHHDCVPPIVHRDVKPNNILLDSEYEARIADFGLAKVIHNQSEKGFSISGVAGSVGYIAPEMGYASKVTEKSDVYSYGVVLLELLTGRHANDAEFEAGVDIVRWVTSKLWSRDEVTGSLFFFNKWKESGMHVPTPPTKEEEQEMLVMLKLALRCTGAVPTQRPTMREVVEVLSEAWRQSLHCSTRFSCLKLTDMSKSKREKLTDMSKSKRELPHEPLISPGVCLELEYCKAQLSGR